jgi:hypothetical protein
LSRRQIKFDLSFLNAQSGMEQQRSEAVVRIAHIDSAAGLIYDVMAQSVPPRKHVVAVSGRA